MKKFLIRLTVEEDGQDLIEYALLAGFIALASTAGSGKMKRDPLSNP